MISETYRIFHLVQIGSLKWIYDFSLNMTAVFKSEKAMWCCNPIRFKYIIYLLQITFLIWFSDRTFYRSLWFDLNVRQREHKIDVYIDIAYVCQVKSRYFYLFNRCRPKESKAQHTVGMIFLVFLLPPKSGERISLGITVLLSMAIFQELSSEKLPSSSDTFPLLGMFPSHLQEVSLFPLLSLCIQLPIFSISLHSVLSDWEKTTFLSIALI